jgi:hypothetical protein
MTNDETMTKFECTETPILIFVLRHCPTHTVEKFPKVRSQAT